MSARAAGLLVACALPVSLALAEPLPKNCQEVAMYDGANLEKEHPIKPKSDGPTFTVFCHAVNMDGYLVPREYLTLQRTGGDFNFGQYTWSASNGFDPDNSASSVRTSFTKVRIDPDTLKVDLGDFAFANSQGGLMHGTFLIRQMPLGTAMDCNGNGSLSGVANIDLTGTGFRINSRFAASGWGVGTVTFNGTTQSLSQIAIDENDHSVSVSNTDSVTIHGGGWCGASGPVGFGSNVWEAIIPGSKPALQLEYVGTPP